MKISRISNGPFPKVVATVTTVLQTEMTTLATEMTDPTDPATVLQISQVTDHQIGILFSMLTPLLLN